jgi:hypothetical protein
MFWMRKTLILALVVAAVGLALVATGVGMSVTRSDPASTGTRQTCSCGVAAQARLGAFVEVAKRIYAQEHAPVIGRVVARKLDQNAALVRALETGDRRKIRSEARKAVFAHEVRVRVTNGAHVLMDAGLPFVVQGSQGELRSSTGVHLGRVDVSIQDLIGFVKLVDRETGMKVVVRGRRGILQTLFPAAARAHLPKSGNVTIRGRGYLVKSFSEVDFNRNPFTVWILEPAQL